MPIREVALQIDRNASFSASFCWIAGNAGVDPTGTTPLATFRQRDADTPLVSLTGSSSANGQVTYLAPIPNTPLFVDQLQTTILVTIYPIVVFLTVAGTNLLPYPFCRWKLNLTWPDGTSLDIIHGDVEVQSV